MSLIFGAIILKKDEGFRDLLFTKSEHCVTIDTAKAKEGEMTYKIIYSERKSVSISVKAGEVILRSPKGVKREILEKILADNSEWVERAIEKTKQISENHPEPTKIEERALRLAARKYFKEKCPIFAEKMGLEYGRISITGAKTRFGSCSSNKNICFSYRLMTYPEEAREYVIVHELCHLVHMNHSRAFYALLERYMPDYKKRKALLKQ
jgi:predicted metal-dependent hydrolase